MADQVFLDHREAIHGKLKARYEDRETVSRPNSLGRSLPNQRQHGQQLSIDFTVDVLSIYIYNIISYNII